MWDEKIIRAIQSRDESAISQVMEKYTRLLWKIASSVLQNGSERDIEECIADVFIYLWQHPEKFDPHRGRLKTWLSVITRSRAQDRCRQLTRQTSLPLDEALLSVLPSPQIPVEQKEACSQLNTALDQLKEPEREILFRRYYYNQKPREIALALDLSTKQVENHLYQSKQKLRRELKELEV